MLAASTHSSVSGDGLISAAGEGRGACRRGLRDRCSGRRAHGRQTRRRGPMGSRCRSTLWPPRLNRQPWPRRDRRSDFGLTNLASTRHRRARRVRSDGPGWNSPRRHSVRRLTRTSVRARRPTAGAVCGIVRQNRTHGSIAGRRATAAIAHGAAATANQRPTAPSTPRPAPSRRSHGGSALSQHLPDGVRPTSPAFKGPITAGAVITDPATTLRRAAASSGIAGQTLHHLGAGKTEEELRSGDDLPVSAAAADDHPLAF